MFLGTPNYWNLKQDPGFFAVEKNSKYFGTFLTPSLREVAKTAPYMHNGMLPTLESVVDGVLSDLSRAEKISLANEIQQNYATQSFNVFLQSLRSEAEVQIF